MFNSNVIDTFLSLVVIYLSLSLVCSGLNEWLATALQRRPKVLRDSIRELIGQTLTDKLYMDPVIRSLRTPVIIRWWWNIDRLRDPSYIPERTFVLALLRCLGVMPEQSEHFIPPDFKVIYERIRIIASSSSCALESIRNAMKSEGSKSDEAKLEDLRNTAKLILDVLEDVTATTTYARSASPFDAPSPPETTSLNAIISSDDAKSKLDKWFRDAMDRASGWYKRRTQIYLFFWGLLVSVTCNADTFEMARIIWRDANMRTALSGAALDIAKTAASSSVTVNNAAGPPSGAPKPAYIINQPTPSPELAKAIANIVEQNFQQINKPLGWNKSSESNWMWKLAGFLVTSIALSLGAPFWFELLNKIVNLRPTGKPVHTSDDRPAPPTKQS